MWRGGLEKGAAARTLCTRVLKGRAGHYIPACRCRGMWLHLMSGGVGHCRALPTNGLRHLQTAGRSLPSRQLGAGRHHRVRLPATLGAGSAHLELRLLHSPPK